jgi:hypothetical protein
MSQIDITILKQGIPGKKVLSCSLFKMTAAYRDFSKYERHFTQFLKYASKYLKDFVVRVYTDDSAKEECLRLSRDHDFVSVYHYNCPPLRDGPGHAGIFGMFPRFLPLFEEGLDIVWVTDIDITDSFLNPKLITAMKRNKADVFIASGLCAERKPWLHVKYPIIAHKFISFKTFPRQLLTRFLTKLISGEFDEFVAEINEYNTRSKTPTPVPYGMDEAFLNSSLYNYIKKKDLTVLVYKDYFVVNNMFTYKIENFPEKYDEYLKTYYRTQDSKMFPKAKAIYLQSIPKVVDIYPCLQEFIDVADQLKTSFVKVILIPSSEL